MPGRAEEWPAFLPAWFGAAFTVDGLPMVPVSQQEKDGIRRVVLESADNTVRVTIDHRDCNPGVCEQVLRNGLQYLNTGASRRRGQLLWANDTELRASWTIGDGREENFMFRLPGAITAWIVVRHKAEPADTTPSARRLLDLVNRWRADTLLGQPEDTALAGWMDALWAHARGLHARGENAAALAVLRRLVTAAGGAPVDPALRLDLAEWETDAAAAQRQARLVLEQAEDTVLAERAARLSGIMLPSMEDLPVLTAQAPAKGPELVLVAMPPVDVRLLRDAARAYEQATGITVRLVRLAAPFEPGKAERFLGQLQVEQDIAKRRRKTVDFTGWDRERYAAELRAVTAHEDAQTRFMYERAAELLPDRPLQYRSGPLLARFQEAIGGLRARDHRVMYVGVTGAGLFRDDALFLLGDIQQGTDAAGIVSYNAMQARTMEETHQSRPRLVDRLAKQLVVASLIQLDLPRPSDPADPYAEGSSLRQLDSKTLTLSEPTRAAIEALR